MLRARLANKKRKQRGQRQMMGSMRDCDDDEMMLERIKKDG